MVDISGVSQANLTKLNQLKDGIDFNSDSKLQGSEVTIFKDSAKALGVEDSEVEAFLNGIGAKETDEKGKTESLDKENIKSDNGRSAGFKNSSSAKRKAINQQKQYMAQLNKQLSGMNATQQQKALEYMKQNPMPMITEENYDTVLQNWKNDVITASRGEATTIVAANKIAENDNNNAATTQQAITNAKTEIQGSITAATTEIKTEVKQDAAAINQNIDQEGASTRATVRSEGKKTRAAVHAEGAATRAQVIATGEDIKAHVTAEHEVTRGVVREEGAATRATVVQTGEKVIGAVREEGAATRDAISQIKTGGDGNGMDTNLQGVSNAIESSEQKYFTTNETRSFYRGWLNELGKLDKNDPNYAAKCEAVAQYINEVDSLGDYVSDKNNEQMLEYIRGNDPEAVPPHISFNLGIEI